jgi:hypothetical protein
MREKRMPSKALISDRCPVSIVEMIKLFLAQCGIEPGVSHCVLPYDLWLANGNNKTDEKKSELFKNPYSKKKKYNAEEVQLGGVQL